LVSNEQIERWKSIYGKVFKITLQENTFIYRRPNLGEILSLQVTKNENKAAGYILDCILYPIDKGVVLPGEYIILKDKICSSVKLQTDEDLENYISDARKRVNVYSTNMFFIWKMSIIKVFPAYTFDVLDKLQVEDFMDLLILAETQLGYSLTKFGSVEINPKNKKIDKDGAVKVEEYKEGIDTKRKPTFLSQEELNRIAIENSTKELENVYFNKVIPILPTHQEGEQIKNKNWKNPDIHQAEKRKISIPQSIMTKK